MAKSRTIASMPLRVLGYREDGAWVAHCLETDLVGRGRTFGAALENLEELTEMQVAFAVQMKQPTLLDHPAPPEIWESYARLAREQMQNIARHNPTPARALGTLQLPAPLGFHQRTDPAFQAAT